MLTDRVARVVQRTLMAHFGIYTVVTTFIDIIWLILGKYSSLSLQIATIAFNGLCLIYVFIFAFTCRRVPAFVDVIALSIMLLGVFIFALVPFVILPPPYKTSYPTVYESSRDVTFPAGMAWGQFALLLLTIVWEVAFTILRKHDWHQPFARSRYTPKILPSGCRRDRRAQMAAGILLAWICGGSLVGLVFNAMDFSFYQWQRERKADSSFTILNADQLAPAYACQIPLMIMDAFMIIYTVVFMVVRAKSRRYIAVGWHIVVLTFYVLIQAGAGTGAWIAPGMIYIYKPGTKYEEYIDYTPALDAIVAWILGFIALVTILFEAIFTSVHHGSAGWKKPFAQYSTSREVVAPFDPRSIQRQADQFDIDGELAPPSPQLYDANPIRPESKAWTDPPASVADYSTIYTPYDPPLPVQHSRDSKPGAAAAHLYPGAYSSTDGSSTSGAMSASASVSASRSGGMDDLDIEYGSQENLPLYTGQVGRSASGRSGSRHRDEPPPPSPWTGSSVTEGGPAGWGRMLAVSGGDEKAQRPMDSVQE